MTQRDPKIRRKLALVALLVLGAVSGAAAGCGGASKAASASGTTGASTAAVSTSTAKLPQPETQSDADLDSDTYPGEPDNDKNHVFGHVADASDRQAALALVERYFAAAAAGDGAAACGLMYSSLSESMAEDYGAVAGSPYMRGTTCPAVMSGLLKHFRARLATERATLKVAQVRVRGNFTSVRMGFAGAPAKFYLELRKERGTWRLDRMIPTEQSIYVE